jgi:hypothetical protein
MPTRSIDEGSMLCLRQKFLMPLEHRLPSKSSRCGACLDWWRPARNWLMTASLTDAGMGIKSNCAYHQLALRNECTASTDLQQFHA